MSTVERRKYTILIIFISVGLIFLMRLFYLQVIDDQWEKEAANISERKKTVYPARGLVYDRNGTLLVANTAVYDLMVIPKKMNELDTLEFCQLIGITKEEFDAKLEKAITYSRYKPSVFEKQIPGEDYAKISEKLYKYRGFYGQSRTLRTYPEKTAAHLLGYISEVNANTIEKNPYYKSGDYIGISGLERTYEEELRGKRGVKYILVDVFNNEKGSYKNGAYDTLAISGKDITTTLDAELQAYGELLMENKIGSIVAIEPGSGELLTLVSSPTYDPNLLVGRIRGKNYAMLDTNQLKPLFNRALMAKYPPGSIFKTVQALIAQQEGVADLNTRFACNKSLVGCHNHVSPLNLQQSVQHSCNPYYYNLVKRIINQRKSTNTFTDSKIGLDIWHHHVTSFGLGLRLDIDLPSVKKGNVPSSEFYDRIYGKGRWAFSTIRSISIGQGEMEVVPLQMANLAAILANKGYYYTPHIVKAIDGADEVLDKFKVKQKVTVDPQYFELVWNGMQDVVEKPGGTARRARVDSLTICGKTGTAQNPHGEDHSVFIAFAPRENPKIALAVYVENSGGGGLWAAPIASLLIEKYLNDSISRPETERRILEANSSTLLNEKQQDHKGEKHRLVPGHHLPGAGNRRVVYHLFSRF